MKRIRINPYPSLEEAITETLRATTVAAAATHYASRQALATYGDARRLPGTPADKIVDGLVLVIRRLDAAREASTLAAAALRPLLRRLPARAKRPGRPSAAFLGGKRRP